MKNTADVTGGKPIAVLLQSISGVSAINPLVRHPWRKGRGAILLFCPGHHTRHFLSYDDDDYEAVIGSPLLVFRHILCLSE
jgi:hypothetical protein